MSLLSTEVEVGLCNNIKYYESLGYVIPRTYDKRRSRYSVKRGTTLLVKISDLPQNSHVKVNVQCNCCKKIYQMEYRIYNKFVHANDVNYCEDCACKMLNSRENNWKWNFQKTDEERINGRNYFEYSIFVKKVLARDNYTCQCCGKTHIYLEVHHLDGYDWCFEKRIDDTNGITLCQNCHANFHYIYGRGGNTKEQFEEWIKEVLEIQKISQNILLPVGKKVYCFEDNQTYDSVNCLCKMQNLNPADVYMCCNKRQGATVYKKHYLWDDDVCGLSQDEIYELIRWQKINHLINIKDTKHKPIICLTTRKVFISSMEAERFYNQKIHASIIRCCRNTQKTAGLLNDGTKLTWMYYIDYLKEDNI